MPSTPCRVGTHADACLRHYLTSATRLARVPAPHWFLTRPRMACSTSIHCEKVQGCDGAPRPSHAGATAHTTLAAMMPAISHPCIWRSEEHTSELQSPCN